MIQNAVAAALTVAGRYDESLEQMQKVIDAGFAIPMTYELAGTLSARKGLEEQGVEFILKSLPPQSNDEEIKKACEMPLLNPVIKAFGDAGFNWLLTSGKFQSLPSFILHCVMLSLAK